MPRPYRSIAILSALVLTAAPAAAQSDWDLYMMRLVNRARVNPSAEPGIIGSAVTDPSAPLAPLAYHPLVANAAANHNAWMHDNLGGIASSGYPDSFTHYETWNGVQGATPASGTANFTGAGIGDRVTFAGFSWSYAAENISTVISTATIGIDKARIDGVHLGLWESAGHRANMLSPNFTNFGFEAEARPFAQGLGNIPTPFDNLFYSTQNFSRPLFGDLTYAFGVLYDDLDETGEWTPVQDNDPAREGLAGIGVTAFNTGTSTVAATATTMDTGAYSLNLGDGTYDVEFALPGGTVRRDGVSISGANTDMGDVEPDRLYTDVDALSLTTGGLQQFNLNAPPSLAGKTYVLLASISGTTPGITVDGVPIPINIDFFTKATLKNNIGVLGALGDATIVSFLPPSLPATLENLTIHYAYIVMDDALENVIWASNPASLTLLP